jgi:kinesin family member C1
VSELEELRSKGTQENAVLQAEIQRYKMEIAGLSTSLDDWKRKYNDEVCSATKIAEELRRAHANEIDDLQRTLRRDVNKAQEDAEQVERRKDRAHEEALSDLKRKFDNALEEEEEKRRKAVKEVSSEGSLVQQKLEGTVEAKGREILALREDLDRSKQETAEQKELNRELRSKLSDSASLAIAHESTMRSLKARIEFLESDCKSQSQAFGDLEQRTQDAIREADEAKTKLRTEETLRRKLHNQIQELKGNIRVFCRVRPTLEVGDSDQAQIMYPDVADDCKEMEVLGPDEKSSLGKVTCKRNAFSFDRVFEPAANNSAVFDEISQLVQSALDGYNVCIFCYGQTGSGKTYTMSSSDGMIPRAVNQIFETAQSLEEKGWRYSMEGSFVEVYNENINDLLGRAEDFDKKKHEIHHDIELSKTTITDVTNVPLDSSAQLEKVLRKAMNNRSVAATKANERSSRSHSVFILRLTGENSTTGERSEGTLNLVDLAGSERLSHSGATGERLKETQNINKSLSCLGDVIGALGQGREGGHIPYRNSKVRRPPGCEKQWLTMQLTYLLQFSLGGNSKTLMFVMVSPFKDHLGETLTSLRFATKVCITLLSLFQLSAMVS